MKKKVLLIIGIVIAVAFIALAIIFSDKIFSGTKTELDNAMMQDESTTAKPGRLEVVSEGVSEPGASYEELFGDGEKTTKSSKSKKKSDKKEASTEKAKTEKEPGTQAGDLSDEELKNQLTDENNKKSDDKSGNKSDKKSNKKKSGKNKSGNSSSKKNKNSNNQSNKNKTNPSEKNEKTTKDNGGFSIGGDLDNEGYNDID